MQGIQMKRNSAESLRDGGLLPGAFLMLVLIILIAHSLAIWVQHRTPAPVQVPEKVLFVD